MSMLLTPLLSSYVPNPPKKVIETPTFKLRYFGPKGNSPPAVTISGVNKRAIERLHKKIMQMIKPQNPPCDVRVENTLQATPTFWHGNLKKQGENAAKKVYGFIVEHPDIEQVLFRLLKRR